MRRHNFVVLAILFLASLPCAQNNEHMHGQHKMEAAPINDSPIRITINPETRVSVELASALPAPAPCWEAVELRVKIVNQGFLTSSLEARLVGDAPAGVTLDFHPAALKGVPEEFRSLYITLNKPDPTDLTIAFRAHNDSSDLGGRDRIHFLLRCRLVQ
jgi:hypothetical protein